MSRARASLLAGLALLALPGSSGCSVGLLTVTGDEVVVQKADVTATDHPEGQEGTVTVLVERTDDRPASKVVTLRIPESVGAWTNARIARSVTEKEGVCEDKRIYHRVEVQTPDGWVEVAEVEGYTRPASPVAKVFAGILFPVGLAFDVALFPVYVWGAVFVKFILPDKPFG